MPDDIKPDPQDGGTPTRPDWLPERYETPEAFAAGHKELERKLTELSERAKQADALEENANAFADRIAQLEAQQQAQQQTNDPAEMYVNAIQQASEMGDYRTLTGAFTQIAQLAARQEIGQALPQVEKRYQTLEESQANEIGAYAARTMEQRYGDQFEQARTVMHEIAQANPNLIPEAARYDPQAAVTALENIYKIATYGAAPAQPDASAAEQAKQAAQTATGAGTRVLSPDEAKQEWDAIRAAAQRSYWEPQT